MAPEMDEETQNAKTEPNSEGKPEQKSEEELEFAQWLTEDQKERLKAEMKGPTPDWMCHFNAAPLFRGDDGPANKLIWTGTRRALADWILQAWRDGKLKAKSALNALDQAAVHFVVEEESGELRELNGKSLQQNLSNRRDTEGK
jgi:hypothetical protein